MKERQNKKRKGVQGGWIHRTSVLCPLSWDPAPLCIIHHGTRIHPGWLTSLIIYMLSTYELLKQWVVCLMVHEAKRWAPGGDTLPQRSSTRSYGKNPPERQWYPVGYRPKSPSDFFESHLHMKRELWQFCERSQLWRSYILTIILLWLLHIMVSSTKNRLHAKLTDKFYISFSLAWQTSLSKSLRNYLHRDKMLNPCSEGLHWSPYMVPPAFSNEEKKREEITFLSMLWYMHQTSRSCRKNKILCLQSSRAFLGASVPPKSTPYMQQQSKVQSRRIPPNYFCSLYRPSGRMYCCCQWDLVIIQEKEVLQYRDICTEGTWVDPFKEHII